MKPSRWWGVRHVRWLLSDERDIGYSASRFALALLFAGKQHEADACLQIAREQQAKLDAIWKGEA